MPAVSAAAGARIRRYSLGVAVVGIAVAIATVVAVIVPRLEREAASAVNQPWLSDEILVAEPEGPGESGGVVWGAERSALVELPAELRGRPIALRLVSSETSVSAFLGDREARDRSPRYLGGVWSTDPMPIAAYDGSELWITSPEPWRIEILPIDPEELEDSASGAEDAVFVHRGDASSGTIAWNGKGSLYIIARTTEGYESLIAASSDRDDRIVRFAWESSPFAVIEVSVYDGARWAIELDGGER